LLPIPRKYTNLTFVCHTLPTMKDNLIVKHNDFLNLGYKLSLNEQRILLACISQVDSRNTLDQGMDFVITVVDGGQKPRIYGACTKKVLTFCLN
jgi:hypothetical protein